MVKLLMIDNKGLILGAIMSLVIYSYVGVEGIFIFFSFVAVSTYITKQFVEYKKTVKLYEYERGLENVFSNGIVPTITAILSQQIGIVPFLSSIAAATADKFASEIGVLDKNVYDIITLKRVMVGTNGGISMLGLLASLAGSSLIALLSLIIYGFDKEAIIIAISGFIGSLADSIAGHFEEKGIGSKSTSNIMAGVVSSIISILLNKGW